jgi:hypothetical protein
VRGSRSSSWKGRLAGSWRVASVSPLTAGKPPLAVLFTCCSVQRNSRSDEALLPGGEEITLLSGVGDPDPDIFGPPGSFPFLIKVLSGLK